MTKKKNGKIAIEKKFAKLLLASKKVVTTLALASQTKQKLGKV
jgi:hypothetical protein